MADGFPAQGISVEQFLSYLQSYLYDLYRKSVRASIPGYGSQWVEQHVYTDLENVRQSIQTSGFGPQTPYYHEVLQYYSSVAGYLNPLLEYYQATQPQPTIGGYEVETIGGYDFAVVRDSTGNIIDLRSLGQAEAEGLTAWQQAQLSNWNQEFQLQQQQLAQQQQQAMMQQQQAMMPYGQMTAYQQAQMGLAEQAQWAETMSMPPSGWIEQWYRMQGGQGGRPSYACAPKSSPQCKDMTWPEYQKKLKQTQEVATGAIEDWERGESLPSAKDMPLPGNWIPSSGVTPSAVTGTVTEPGIMPLAQYRGLSPPAGQQGLWVDPDSGTVAPRSEFTRPAGTAYQPISFPGTFQASNLAPYYGGGFVEPQTGSVFMPSTTSEAYAATYPGRKMYTDVKTGAQVAVVDITHPRAVYEGKAKTTKAPTAKRPTTPPAPPGLSQFVPSQVTGQPITRAPTSTPSGQMWGQTPWSTQEMLRGYTQWAGYRPYEDIMQHMYAMLPQTPAGAGRKYWTPAKQYA